MHFLTSATAAIAVASAAAFVPSTPFFASRSSALFMSTAESDTTGKVKWYNAERGFGFVAVDDGSEDMFVHATGLTFAGPLIDGERISFDSVIDSRTGKPKAINVLRVSGEAPTAIESVVEKVIEIVKEVAAAVEEVGSVDYDATARIAYEASGASGDFDAYKAQYLADTSASITKKHQDTIGAEYAAAEKAAAEAAAAAEAKAAAEAAAAKEAKAAADVKAETFQRARLQAQLEQTIKDAAAAVDDVGVDYDATARIAYEASGASGDFDAYKVQYLADISAGIAKKHQDTIGAEYAAAEKAAAEAAAAAEAKAAAEAAAAKEAKAEAEVKAETFQRARLQAQLEQMAKKAAAAADDVGVDYDATARIAFEASGASGDFDAYKSQYLADTSADIAKKHQDTIGAEYAAAEKAAAEAAAAAEAKAAAEAAAAKEAEEKAEADAAAAAKAEAEAAAAAKAEAEAAAAAKAEAEAAAQAEADAAAAAKAEAEAAAQAEADAAAAAKSEAEAAAAKAEAEAAAAANEAEEAMAKELGSPSVAIMKAREQPKSPEEEAALGAKYGALDLETKAFTILVDLGMIDLNPDPDDPNRDSSKDDEDME